MRYLALVLSFIVLSSLLQAQVTKYPVEDFLHIRFEADEAERVYRTLNLPDLNWTEGEGRVFQTSQESIELYCFNRHYNVIPWACHFTFDLRGLKSDIKFKAERNGIRLVLTQSEDIERLREDLLENPLVVGQNDVVIECNSENCSVLIK